ncbi:MAG: flagellin [Pseudomonadota bacterium]|jgi:flagellin|uniref:flagellin N-terminal helical domain-containing protein n=1 Tax=Marisediminitalea TaxID=2662254 RepID=UPI000C530BDD|nr:flagellin [Marisediminitalea aggregata]MBL52677.1 flagellin [Alteromonadaceae bacterium]MCP3865962.1 flagellin [Aestuariibacter sp.]MEC7823625.1 flagellin [Pseudomonadota bacterium]MCP4233673.1 flagellin [Aestuariibacter sp.]MCP4527132.1 flagellin [Aestuariibacter sp.]|tara:strand:- start:690 stop:1490 length:801 start_codon:yes stop_codon:yes gene_type:complete
MIKLNSDTSTSLLQQVQERQQSLAEKLASGKQINSAADGAAAQQIIDRLTSQVEGNRQAVNNVYDGISLAQVAEGGLEGINNDVNRIRELSVQAGSGILSAADKQAIQSEITQLQENITQTIDQTNFAGKPLLSSDSEINFQVGAQAGQQISVNTRDIASELNGVLNIDVTSQSSEDVLAAADAAVEVVGSARGDLGAVQNQLASTARNLTQSDVNTAAARSRIQDTDYAQAVSQQAANDVLGQASLTVQAQANQQQGQVLSLLNG